MLQVQSKFPHAGSTAFLRPDEDRCRIVRHNPGTGTALVMLAHSRDASATRTVDLHQLAPTEAEAWPKPARGRRVR